MTEEERQKLVASLLRKYAKYHESLPTFTVDLMLAAADQIERLVNELKEERKKPKLRIRQVERPPFVIEELNYD